MRILVITQKVDSSDPVLGFFHRWLTEFAKKFQHITVICLGRGQYDLPQNVTVLSLGKETKPSRIHYILNFYRYLWQERKNYDIVFVHMNQEYILLAGPLWKLWGKKVFLWRNHVKGNWLTTTAAALSDKVFATSPNSFTAQFRKTIIMPAGVDTDFFQRQSTTAKKPGELLVLSRLSSVKNIDTIIRAFGQLRNSATNLLIVGDGPEKERLLKLATDLNIAHRITWHSSVKNERTVDYYNSAEISLNATNSGSLDKTIIEAMACEQLVLVSNRSFAGAIPEHCLFTENDSTNLAAKLHALMALPEDEKRNLAQKLRMYAVSHHSLKTLVDRLAAIFMETKPDLRPALVVRYLVAGVLGLLVNIFVFYLLADVLNVWYLAAGVISFIISLIASFIFQKFIAFKDRRPGGTHRKFILFSIIFLFNLAANTLILYICTDLFGIYHLISQIIASALIAVWSFFLYRIFVFESHTS